MTSSWKYGRRVRDWDVLLGLWARGLVGRPFEWGETDCVSIVRAEFGLLYGRPFPEKIAGYSTIRGAVRAAKGFEERWTSPAALLLAIGAEERPWRFAQTGDVIYAPDEGDDGAGGFPFALAILVSGKGLVASEADGVLLRPLREFDVEACRFFHYPSVAAEGGEE